MVIEVDMVEDGHPLSTSLADMLQQHSHQNLYLSSDVFP